ncbi:MAG TPA: Xaa-Pro peptidase family protein [Bryobacteraceae bacterium]|nr:Xaa-Pro peptidase family protein [Bryobacteraceae bacterium]
MRNPERLDRIRIALRKNQWDLVICALPKNVLLLSGYWPVVGTGVAIASKDGRVALLVPEDEEDLAESGWADEVRTFKPGSLDEILTAAQAIQGPLRDLIDSFSADPVRVGFEAAETSEPASYAAMHLYGGTMQPLLHEVLSRSTLEPADEALADLRSRKTEREIKQLRTACEIAGKAFGYGSAQIKIGESEVETATRFRQPLSTSLVEFKELRRADGFAWCMSGTNSALASGAYARSRAKRIDAGDLALIHMNSHADGYWTDITRTYVIGEPDARQQRMYDAVSRAREAALSTIRPGVKAASVDTAARDVLKTCGFGPHFKHSTGHGVGFSAIDANARPRLHPRSEDILETGMVFNVEPAIYFEGYGGIRHCDVVVVTDSGAEVLTAFQCSIEDLVKSGSSKELHGAFSRQ